MSHTWAAWATKYWGPKCTQKMVRFPMFSVWDRIKRRRFKGAYITVAKDSVRCWKFLRRELKKAAPRYYRKMDDFADDWGFNCRNIGGTSIPSQHAFGLAGDLDATKNYQGRPAVQCPIWQSGKQAIIRWEALGNEWGGRYPNPDGMHFGIELTPQQIKERLTRTGRVKKAHKARVYG